MGKKFRKCINEMRRKARAGRVIGRFSVYADEVKKLEREGFTVTLPHNFSDDKMAGMNLWEVELCWATPTCNGVAARLKKLVDDYRYKYNSISKACQMKHDKQVKVHRNTTHWMEVAEDSPGDSEEFGDFPGDYYDDGDIWA